MSRQGSRSRSRSPEAENVSECESDRAKSVSPISQPISEECYRSENTILTKRWLRGSNSCSRCDFEFSPVATSAWVRRREERLSRPPRQPHSGSTPSNKHRTSLSSGSSRRDRDREGKRSSAPVDIKREDKLSPAPKKWSSEAGPPTHGADAQITSSLMGGGSGGGGVSYPPIPQFGTMAPPSRYGIEDQQAAAAAAFHAMYPMMHDPTPALRQLSEYAKPHIGASAGNGVGPEAYNSGLLSLSHAHPYNKMAYATQRPGSRERLELEIERQRVGPVGTSGDSLRTRDPWDIKDKVKQESSDMKPAGLLPSLDRSSSRSNVSTAGFLPSNQQPQYAGGFQPPSLLHMPPGLYPPNFAAAAAAADWMHRERMEMLGIHSGAAASYMERAADRLASEQLAAERLMAERLAADRLAAERMHAERLAAADRLARDPLYRVDLGAGASVGLGGSGGATVVTTEQSHTHTHSHTHLHLHQPDASTAAPAALFPPAPAFHPLVVPPHMLPPTGPAFTLPPGIDPLSAATGSAAAAAALQQGLAGGAGGGAGATSPHMAYSLAASHQLLAAAAQEQEMLYRELMCRPPYSTDPILAQQLMAQAAAHQEAIYRQLALERERLASMRPR